MKFLIVSCGRNCEAYVHDCIESIAAQQGHDYHAVIVDDASTDLTGDIMRGCLEDSPMSLRSAEMWSTSERRGAVRNQWDAIERGLDFYDADAIVWLDADDKFSHPDVLSRLAVEYEAGAALTFGSYRSVPFSATCPPVGPFPNVVARDGSHRAFLAAKGPTLFNHCRSMSVATWLQLDASDLQDGDGEWFTVSADYAVFVPALEIARDRAHFIPDVLVDYRSDAPDAEWRTATAETNRVHQIVMHRPPKLPVSSSAVRVARFEAVHARKLRREMVKR